MLSKAKVMQPTLSGGPCPQLLQVYFAFVPRPPKQQPPSQRLTAAVDGNAEPSIFAMFEGGNEVVSIA